MHKRQAEIDELAHEITPAKLDDAEVLVRAVAEGLSNLAATKEVTNRPVAALLDKAMMHLYEGAHYLREAQQRAQEN
jgi:hypothetical protein